jgi:hypothetical protein
MVVLRKVDIKNNEIMVKINENNQKGVAYEDFVAPIIQVLNISNIDLLTKLNNHSQRLFVKAE